MNRNISYECEKQANHILKTHPELNKKYPTRERKNYTYLVNFNEIEHKAGAGLYRKQPLNRFERNIYRILSTIPEIENIITRIDLQYAINTLTRKQRYVLERKLEGYTQQEIADLMHISRKNVVKHLLLITLKIRKYFKEEQDEDIRHLRPIPVGLS